jgi:MFS family permease
MSESVSIIAIIVIVVALAAGSLFHLGNPIPFRSEGVKQVMAYYGMAMFSLTAFFSIPQAVNGLAGDKKKVRKAILTGMGINGAFIVIIVLCALASSTKVTELAMIGWSDGVGGWAQWLGYAFTILAMLTTYWSLSMALGDILKEQLKWPAKLCWLIATLPSLLLVLFDFSSFLSLMRTAGGLIAILISLLVIPAYRRCRLENGQTLLSKSLGGPVMWVLVILAYIMMAVGSAVGI